MRRSVLWSVAPLLCDLDRRGPLRGAALALCLMLPVAANAAEAVRPAEPAPAIQLRPPSSQPQGSGGPAAPVRGSENGPALSIEAPGAFGATNAAPAVDFVLSGV